jgi:predicted DCC family thiol-disulfide oxidoreductase YuxK
MSSLPTQSADTLENSTRSPSWKIKLLYDGECPLCLREVNFLGRIHAVLADGTILQNVEVFRQVYDILGIGWIYAATKWPVIGFLVDIIYEIWASWRLTLTGRPNLKTILAERQKRLECNASNRCSQ